MYDCGKVIIAGKQFRFKDAISPLGALLWKGLLGFNHWLRPDIETR